MDDVHLVQVLEALDDLARVVPHFDLVEVLASLDHLRESFVFA